MVIFFTIYLTSIVFILLLIFIEGVVINSLSDKSKFKTWWRKSVIGRIDPHENV
jgi:hypothetical protein